MLEGDYLFTGMYAVDLVCFFAPGMVEVPAELEVHPEVGGGAEELGESQCGAGRDAALSCARPSFTRWKGTWMAVASSLCVIPRGSRNSSNNISPGWVGSRSVGMRTMPCLLLSDSQ